MSRASSFIRQFAAALALILGGVALDAPARAATPVTVDATSPVTVDNSTAVAAAIAKALGVGAPFQENVNCTLGLTSRSCVGTYTVPSSISLVIEYLSFFCQTSGSTPKFGGFNMVSTGAGVTGNIARNLARKCGQG